MNIIKHELKSSLKSLLIWSGITIAFIFMAMTEFKAYYNNPEMADILEAMPQGLLDAFSMSGSNLTTVTGYVNIMMIYFYILVSLHAILLGTGIIAKEERDKTAEFLLTLPVSRSKLLVRKILAALLLCLGLLLVTVASIYASVMPYDLEAGFHTYMGKITLSMGLLQLLFLSIGLLMASLIKRYKRSGAYGVFFLFATYILSVLVNISDQLTFLKYVSPFKYFEPNQLLHGGSFEGIYLILTGLFILISIGGTFYFYPRRDLFI